MARHPLLKAAGQPDCLDPSFPVLCSLRPPHARLQRSCSLSCLDTFRLHHKQRPPSTERPATFTRRPACTSPHLQNWAKALMPVGCGRNHPSPCHPCLKLQQLFTAASLRSDRALHYRERTNRSPHRLRAVTPARTAPTRTNQPRATTASPQHQQRSPDPSTKSTSPRAHAPPHAPPGEVTSSAAAAASAYFHSRQPLLLPPRFSPPCAPSLPMHWSSACPLKCSMPRVLR